MAVHLQLDKPHSCFTNLDLITGKVILSIFTEETISAINVKLESESRTRLAAPVRGGPGGHRNRDRNTQLEIEVHKLLYKVQKVFPSLELLQQSPNNSTFTLPPGSHEYPFQFKIPFNNACSPMSSIFANLNIAMEVARDTNRHTSNPLPPTLTGFPGEAEIRYYVKVTVQRPAFYKENFRASADFKFLPIEPPRPPVNTRETYARREHQFAPHIPSPPKQSTVRKQSSTSSYEVTPPKISIDGRLPDPAIVTCNEPIPLRVLVKKLNETSEIIFLNLFQIELIGYTQIRAHDLSRQEVSSCSVVSLANLHTPLGNSNTPSVKDVEISNKLWSNVSLPNNIPPSFETCNLSRTYVLEIRVGLMYGSPGNMKPELTVQPLRMPVQVYSGIRPPPALLAEMQKKTGPANLNVNQQSTPNIRPPASWLSDSQPPPFSPTTRPSSTSTTFAPLSNEFPAEAPPSYEDALAEDLAPVDGPRRDYIQPQAAPMVTDSKRGGLFGNSERLFRDRE